MPEPPDFARVARELTDRTFPADVVTVPKSSWTTRQELVDQLAEQLRLIWNARGAADISQLESILSGLMGVTAAGPYVKNLDRALRSLDR